MSKRCGFCDFSTEIELAFTDHMRTVHQWGVAAPAMATAPYGGLASPLAMPVPSVTGDVRFCGNCGAARDSLSTNFCRNCGASFVGAVPSQPMSLAFAPKAGFWVRSGAYLVDLLAWFAFGIAAVFALGLFLGLTQLNRNLSRADIGSLGNVLFGLVEFAYFVVLWSRFTGGQTLGMKAFRLRVIRTDGSDLSVPRSFLRWIGLNLSILALFVGLIWAAFDRNKQGWHDKLADTYVVRTA